MGVDTTGDAASENDGHEYCAMHDQAPWMSIEYQHRKAHILIRGAACTADTGASGVHHRVGCRG